MIALLCLVATAEVPEPLFPRGEELGVEVVPEEVWYNALPPEEQVILGLVDEAVDLTVDRLSDEGRLKGEGIPWVAWMRDSMKLVFGLIVTLLLARMRRPASVDEDQLAKRVVEMLPMPAPGGPSSEEAALRAELAALRRDNASLIDQANASTRVSGIDEASYQPEAVAELGRQALRRRR